MKIPYGLWGVALLLLLLNACTQDAYEKGEGKYSSLRADFVEAHAGNNKLVDYAVTDDGDRLDISVPYSASWVKTPDSLYRGILYYKGTGASVEVVALSSVSVIDSLVPKDSLKQGLKMDPLTLESIWVSKNKRYLNAGIWLKGGETDDSEAAHRIGVVSDTLIVYADGKRTLRVLLYHDQGGMPEYYSQRSYFSVLLPGIQADSLQFTVNTYDGTVVNCLPVR